MEQGQRSIQPEAQLCSVYQHVREARIRSLRFKCFPCMILGGMKHPPTILGCSTSRRHSPHGTTLPQSAKSKLIAPPKYP